MAITDACKPSFITVIKSLRTLSLEVVMLTGDNQSTVQAIARELVIISVFAEVRPDFKAAKVKELQQTGKVVVMVEDGINNFSALAQADVATATSNITLISEELLEIVIAIRLNKAIILNTDINF